MYRGNFDIEDYVVERVALSHADVGGDSVTLHCERPTAEASLNHRRQQRQTEALDPSINRFWLRVVAEKDECVWGGGEQMSYFNMRGRKFPLWTSEPGVGRDKTTELTFKADITSKAGGDYYHTNYPQPTYVSSRRYALHVETTAYSVFDFRRDGFHEIEAWAVPERLEFFAADSFKALVGELSLRFGRQPELPEWVYNGAIIGLKDGEQSFARLEKIRAAGVKVSGLWCEDWVGLRHTSFGARLFWDWKANEERYPHSARRSTRLPITTSVSSAVNPYLCVDGSFFPEAEAKGYFAKNDDGETALVDFGEFDCGVVDFTNRKRWTGLPKPSLARTCSITASPAGWRISASTFRSTFTSPTE